MVLNICGFPAGGYAAAPDGKIAHGGEMSGVYIEICREVWYNNLSIIAARPQAAAEWRGFEYGDLCSEF